MVILPSLRSAEVVEWPTVHETIPIACGFAVGAPTACWPKRNRRSAFKIARIIDFNS